MQVLFINLLFLSNILYSQIKITYEVTYKPDTTQNKYQVEEMSLKHFEGKSYFYNESKFKLDSIYDKVTTDFLKTGLVPNVSLRYDLNFGIYKNFITKEFYTIQNISSRNFVYMQNSNQLEWKITKEKKIIHTYNCKKAVVNFGGRVWDAWFTEEIPINDGPYKFQGLPGLILEIADRNKDYHFSTIRISKLNEKVKLSTLFINTTEEKFTRVKNRLIDDPALFVRESIMKNKNVSMQGTDGNNLDPNELYERIYRDSELFRKTHNNPIEMNEIWLK